MKCPNCKSAELTPDLLESDLSAQSCPQCGGHWIPGAQYWSWLERRSENLPERAPEASDPQITETREHLDCPECRWRMVKYLVGRGTGFSLDHCHGCKGIWFDRNEWRVLRKRHLHDDLNSILTEFWQREAAREERRKRLEQIYVAKFGAEDYAEIKRVRAWLDSHRKKHELLAYLTDENPLGT